MRRVADIDTEKIAPPVVVAGTEMTYKLKTRNRGPSDSTNITLEDELPANVRFVAAHPSQGTCSASAVSGVTTVSCALGTVASGNVATVDIVVFVPSSLAAGTIIGDRKSVV